jgi:ketosteroid isomerase-like protein
MSDRNIQVVKDAYAAFFRGDIPGVLAMVAEDVEWQGVKGAEGVVPHAGTRRGRAQVEEFFALLAGNTRFKTFQPKEFIASEDSVAVVGYYEATIMTTGRHVASDWVMTFTIKDGKITQFREFTDSAAFARAHALAPAFADAT